METLLIYVLCTRTSIGHLSIEVDGHVNPKHKALRYVTRPDDLAGAPRGSICVDLLERGGRSRYEGDIRAIAQARDMRSIEIWKLKAVFRQIKATE